MASLFSSLFGNNASTYPAATVASIFIYPIKSCRGISVPQARVTTTGFRWDRQWLVVNSKGRAFTQRVEPKLALVTVEMPVAAFAENWQPSSDSYLELKAPGMEVLKVPLSRTCEKVDGVSMWEWSGSALDEGSVAADWFSTYLDKPARLVRFNTDTESRAVDPQYAGGYKTMFTDEFPFLLLSQASMDALNKLLPEPVPVNRFRPKYDFIFSIFVDGCESFTEDLWAQLKINDLTFHGVNLCSRCKVPTVNQETGVFGPEPNETLMKMRSDRELRPSKKQGGKIYFGQNLLCKESISNWNKSKTVKVGDHVFVLKKVLSAEEAPA